uniref:AlNc14C172G8038 protein n=1 Tax=Albugo laibachii Nc14 TaxID=890382 RepID=F0WNL5_9STRA|nr:AlNc14C172G8038 [Albugo laibachii Nc14]|eukprot:CCA22906.1 AlNc14C172G8038 [Albugo laibachii Nc14]
MSYKMRDIETIQRYCRCPQCEYAFYSKKTSSTYRCNLPACYSHYTDVLDFLEHQEDFHGYIAPHTAKTRAMMYNQQSGREPLPPFTVYIGQQFIRPWIRPVRWTMDNLKEESKTLIAQLERSLKANRYFIWRAFEEAKKMVEDEDVTLESHYQAALEYYNSSLTHPTAITSDNEEVIAPVGMGYNWLSFRGK